MERIKQAIEKVKSQNSSEAGRKQARPSVPDKTANTRAAKPQEELVDIRYEYTRTVKLRKEHLEKNRIVAFDKSDPKCMTFDLLRTHVLQIMQENGWRTLAITSPTPEAGKTVVAINLAMSIAQQTNKTAMLVDFDLRRPKVGAYLGIHMEKSLNDLLEGTAELQDVLVNPDMPRLVVLPTKSAVRHSSETLSSSKVADLIKDLREHYKSRIVIFDLPPLLVTDDAIALLPQIDCVLMVVANGMTTKREIEDSLRLLPTANLIGTILNKAEVDQKAYYYD
ncbi:MAG: CpsD/CapB family tyrosine-protein kinase [Sideroxyarcus sp.]|nr:CpsD/CapB family tyrosine-protein kinase [Sideroxyarcus sp.]